MSPTNPSNKKKETEITVYGATSFVAKHVLRYLVEAVEAEESSSSATIRITLGGRNPTKLKAIKEDPEFVNSKAIADIFVAPGSDLGLLKEMAARTSVVINCAGPYSQYSNLVVQACAEMGTDYVDITGEGYWNAVMRQKHGAAAQESGARIISMCGYDSIPTDLVVFAAVQALKAQMGGNATVPIEEIKVWHQALGIANGGTVHTAVDYEWDALNDFTKTEKQSRSLRKVPFMVGDPLQLTHPSNVRYNPDFEKTKNSFAMGEWLNQMITFDRNFFFGVSIPMPMAAINLKVLQASAVALKYGTETLQVRERLLPLGFFWTRIASVFAFIPMLCIQLGTLAALGLFKVPKVGKAVAQLLAPPGSGAPDWLVKMGSCAVYAVVTAPRDDGSSNGTVDRGYAYLAFEGDPGNAVTAQCVCESALALLLERESLPPKSVDGFGTPAELLGPTLLKRFQKTMVRPVTLKTTAKLGTSRNEMKLYLD